MIQNFEELVEYLSPVIDRKIWPVIFFDTETLSSINRVEGIEGDIAANLKGSMHDYPQGIYIKNNLSIKGLFKRFIDLDRKTLFNTMETLMRNKCILNENENLNPILWACRTLFHEIGHIVDFNNSNCNNIEDFLMIELQERANYSLITKMLKNDVQLKINRGEYVPKEEVSKLNDSIEELYRNIPSERRADDYAIDMIADNIEFIRKLY